MPPGADVYFSLSAHLEISLDLLFSPQPPPDYRSASLAPITYVSQSDLSPLFAVLSLTISGVVFNLMYASGRRSFSSVIGEVNDLDVDSSPAKRKAINSIMSPSQNPNFPSPSLPLSSFLLDTVKKVIFLRLTRKKAAVCRYFGIYGRKDRPRAN